MKGNIPRRHHYIPRYYLKGFSNPSSDLVWTYDKFNEKASFSTNPINIAVEKDFYKLNLYEGKKDTIALEQYFAEEVETPVNIILDKISEKRRINLEEKFKLSFYIYALYRRVPAARERAKDFLPKVANSMLSETSQMIDSHFSHYNDEKKKILRDIAKSFISEQEANPSPLFLKPIQTSNALPAMMDMNWYFLYTNEDHFLTCDNPVFIHKSRGLSQGEFTLPIRKDIALWATSQKKYQKDNSFQLAHSQMIKEMNRRTIKNATNYIYSSKNEDWITKILNKGKIQIKDHLDN